jgi:hypothetical protein
MHKGQKFQKIMAVATFGLISVTRPEPSGAQIMEIEDFLRTYLVVEEVQPKFTYDLKRYYWSTSDNAKYASFTIWESNELGYEEPVAIEIFGCHGRIGGIQSPGTVSVHLVPGYDAYWFYTKKAGWATDIAVFTINGKSIDTVHERSVVSSFMKTDPKPGSELPHLPDPLVLRVIASSAHDYAFEEVVTDSELIVYTGATLNFWSMHSALPIWSSEIRGWRGGIDPLVVHPKFSRQNDIIVVHGIHGEENVLGGFDFAGNHTWTFSLGEQLLEVMGIFEETGTTVVIRRAHNRKKLDVEFISRDGEELASRTVELPYGVFGSGGGNEIDINSGLTLYRFIGDVDGDRERVTVFLAGDFLNPAIHVVRGAWYLLDECQPYPILIGADRAAGQVKAFDLETR